MMMGTVDLDAARAARREAKSEPVTVKLGGKVFTLPVELPFEVLETTVSLNQATNGNGAASVDNSTVAGAVLRVVRLLLGDGYNEFMAMGPSQDDMTTFIEGALIEYGLAGSPNPQASKVSSATTSRRSKRTSSASTG